MKNLFQLSFYVPEENLETVKDAIFAVGAGTVGNYSHACWQTLGTGQFKPLEGSNPHIGSQNKIETVKEYKVELLCSEENLSKAVEALKRAHPYEEPAYFVFKHL